MRASRAVPATLACIQTANRITPFEGRTKRRSGDIAHQADVHPSWPIHPVSTPKELPDIR